MGLPLIRFFFPGRLLRPWAHSILLYGRHLNANRSNDHIGKTGASNPGDGETIETGQHRFGTEGQDDFSTIG
jgi:hypothetical protein